MSGLRVGFTGTQRGISLIQREAAAEWLWVQAARELHHGDCVGADADVHVVALSLSITVVIHPPTIDTKRAWCEGAREVLPPLPYLERDVAIVVATEVLLALPGEEDEVRRSGTWFTVRRARRLLRPVQIIFPSGRRLLETPPSDPLPIT
jgi:hypothetical protein